MEMLYFLITFISQMRKLIFFLGLLVVIFVAGYCYIYQGHRDVASTTSTATYDVPTLLHELRENSTNTSIVDQVITVTGTVSSFQQNEIIIDNKVIVLMRSAIDIKKGDHVSVKGRCIGYDDLLDEIKLDQAIQL